MTEEEKRWLKAAEDRGHKWFAPVSVYTARKLFSDEIVEKAKLEADGYLGGMPQSSSIGLFLGAYFKAAPAKKTIDCP